MRNIIDENWFLDILGEALEKAYGDNVDFTKMEFSKVKNDIYEFVRKTVQSEYGNLEEFSKLQDGTNRLLDKHLPRFGVQHIRK